MKTEQPGRGTIHTEMSLGTWLTEETTRRGWDTAELARTLSMTWAHADRLLNDKPKRKDGQPTERRVSTLKRIAKALDVPFEIVADASLPKEMHGRDIKRPSSPLEQMISTLSNEDKELVYALARRLQTSGTRASSETEWILAPTRVQYDLVEHRLYTHDGRPAGEQAQQDFMMDVDAYFLQRDIDAQKEEAVTDSR